jgi:hypothetical protein
MSSPNTTVAGALARAIPQAFECRPTRPGLASNALPDELMINWGGLPGATAATIYLPGVAANDVLTLSSRLYNGQPFSQVDDHTVRLRATGLTYFPIPPAPLPSPNYAGLLTLTLPGGLSVGHRFNLTIRQLTSVEEAAPGTIALLPSATSLRQVVGAFQLNVTVQSARSLLPPTERSLSFFRWVVSTMTATNRWYPVLIRYLGEIAARVESLGGNPNSVVASPTGSVSGTTSYPPHHVALEEHTGKIESLIYDRFGDFEGFILETEKGEKIHFYSRERHIAELAQFVWTARILITVRSSRQQSRVPERIDLHS